jgi:hypothetical protein
VTRERGNYGPLDRERHFVAGWAADHAVDYARDRTVGAALRPVLPVVDAASRTSRAASRWWTGARGLGGRDAAQMPLTQVGQEIIHTVADRMRAVTSLSTYFRVLVDDLATWQMANTAAPNASTSAQWFAADVTPTLEEWRGFVAQQEASWWTKAATSWETYEEWWNRLRGLRALARAHGILLQSAEPVPLPKTIWQRGAEGKGSEATAILGVLKVGVFTVLTITGALSMFMVLRDLRPKQTPNEAV